MDATSTTPHTPCSAVVDLARCKQHVVCAADTQQEVITEGPVHRCLLCEQTLGTEHECTFMQTMKKMGIYEEEERFEGENQENEGRSEEEERIEGENQEKEERSEEEEEERIEGENQEKEERSEEEEEERIEGENQEKEERSEEKHIQENVGEEHKAEVLRLQEVQRQAIQEVLEAEEPGTQELAQQKREEELEVPRIQEEQRRVRQKEQETERVVTIEAQEKGPKTQHVRKETEKLARQNTEESEKLHEYGPQPAIKPIKWSCTVCNRTMPTYSRASHLAGMKHQNIQRRKQDEEERRTNLAQDPPKVHGRHTRDYEVCQQAISVKGKESDLKGRQHRQVELQQEVEESSPVKNKPSGANVRDNRGDEETRSTIAAESNLIQEQTQTGSPQSVNSGSDYKNTWDWRIYSRPTSTNPKQGHLGGAKQGQPTVFRQFTCDICSRTVPLGSRDLHYLRHDYWAKKVRAAG